jgi:hypothetical protein
MPEKASQEGTRSTRRSSSDLSRAERIFVRLTFWQTVLSVAGIFIALVALYAALTESDAVRRQTAASVWPFVQLSVHDYDTGDAAGFKLTFTNAGVGPARMKQLRMVINGTPVRNWRDAVEVLKGNPDSPVARNYISHRVLRPNETVAMISTIEPDLARRFQAAIANPRNSITYCYCSIFDDCWLVDSRRNPHDPGPVDQCPDFGDAQYRD